MLKKNGLRILLSLEFANVNKSKLIAAIRRTRQNNDRRRLLFIAGINFIFFSIGETKTNNKVQNKCYKQHAGDKLIKTKVLCLCCVNF